MAKVSQSTYFQFNCSCGQVINIVNPVSQDRLNEVWESAHKEAKLYRILKKGQIDKLIEVENIIESLRNTSNLQLLLYADFLDIAIRETLDSIV